MNQKKLRTTGLEHNTVDSQLYPSSNVHGIGIVHAQLIAKNNIFVISNNNCIATRGRMKLGSVYNVLSLFDLSRGYTSDICNHEHG